MENGLYYTMKIYDDKTLGGAWDCKTSDCDRKVCTTPDLSAVTTVEGEKLGVNLCGVVAGVPMVFAEVLPSEAGPSENSSGSSENSSGSSSSSSCRVHNGDAVKCLEDKFCSYDKLCALDPAKAALMDDSTAMVETFRCNQWSDQAEKCMAEPNCLGGLCRRADPCGQYSTSKTCLSVSSPQWCSIAWLGLAQALCVFSNTFSSSLACRTQTVPSLLGGKGAKPLVPRTT